MALDFEEFREIKECKTLWERFSPKESVWDFWDINLSFHKGYDAEPFFILGRDNNKEFGLLPLQHETDSGSSWFDFFGGDYPERRKFYASDNTRISSLLARAPAGTSLCFIDSSQKQFVSSLVEDNISFSLDLKKSGFDIENYFSTFNKKHRKNLKYDLKQLQRLDYTLVWNIKEHLDFAARFNRLRFSDDSNFSDKRFSDSMAMLVESADRLGFLQLLGIKIDNKVEASQTALFYNGTYTVITGGSNPEIKNLGKLLIVEHIKNAIRLRADMIDFMSTESGWKKLWNLDETMLYKFEK
jgi:hypothetical protein